MKLPSRHQIKGPDAIAVKQGATDLSLATHSTDAYQVCDVGFLSVCCEYHWLIKELLWFLYYREQSYREQS